MHSILVVDGTSQACGFVAACLRSSQYNVAAATSVAEAAHLMKLSPPDLVIVNLAMAGMMQLVTTIRTSAELAELPVIGLSDPIEPDVWQHATELRVRDFLPKNGLPVGELQSCVAEHLRESAKAPRCLRGAA